jgi:hypothetical protein
MIPVMDCGQVFYSRPFAVDGERRRCTLPAGHDGPHGAEVERPVWVRKARRGTLPVKVYR